MHYLDGSTRKPTDALGHWIDNEVAADISHLRIMSGYFSLSGLGAFLGIVNSLNTSGGQISAILGANDKATIKDDLTDYLDLVNSPRTGVRTAIASYSNGLFHPKVYHLTRMDGSEFAYVGSANLTDFGINSGNIEAGLILDTRQKDDGKVLSRIAASIDFWLGSTNSAVTPISTHADVSALVANGIVGTKHKSSVGGGTGSGGAKKPSLKPVLNFGKKVKKKKPTTTSSSSIAVVPAVSGSTTIATGSTTSGPEILIAEIGIGRTKTSWQQANIPKKLMLSFFGVGASMQGQITLHEIDSKGATTNSGLTNVFSTKSQNYRFKLSSVLGKNYPSSGRPIAVFRAVGPKEFRYRIFFPSEVGYSALQVYLNTNYLGNSHHLKRISVTSSDLMSVWPGCPV